MDIQGDDSDAIEYGDERPFWSMAYGVFHSNTHQPSNYTRMGPAELFVLHAWLDHWAADGRASRESPLVCDPVA